MLHDAVIFLENSMFPTLWRQTDRRRYFVLSAWRCPRAQSDKCLIEFGVAGLDSPDLKTFERVVDCNAIYLLSTKPKCRFQVLVFYLTVSILRSFKLSFHHIWEREILYLPLHQLCLTALVTGYFCVHTLFVSPDVLIFNVCVKLTD